MVLFVNDQDSARIIDYAYDDPQYFAEIVKKLIKKNRYRIISLLDTNIEGDIIPILKKYKIVKNHLYYHLRKNKSECHITYQSLENSGWSDIKGIDRSDLEDITKWDLKEIASDGV